MHRLLHGISPLLAIVVVLLANLISPAAGEEPASDKPLPIREWKGAAATPLVGTQPLTMEGDIAAQMVDGIDRFLLKELDQSVAGRARFWKRDFASAEAYEKSLAPNRKRLAHILGVRDQRVAPDSLDGVTLKLIGAGQNYKIYRAAWPAVRDVAGAGLLLAPEGTIQGSAICLPDADQTPEQLAGLVEGIPPEAQFARALAQSGHRVLIPQLVDRKLAPRRGRGNFSSREFAYRPAFELGRHLIGYEVQKTLAGVDWLLRMSADEKVNENHPVAVYGYGEGGAIALYAGALDTRIQQVGVSGYFGPREKIWQQPIDRNVFGLLEQFGDAELAAMIAPRQLIVEAAPGPELELSGAGGGAPAKLTAISRADAEAELKRAQDLAGEFGKHLALGELPRAAVEKRSAAASPTDYARFAAERQQRQQYEIERDTQWLLNESQYLRTEVFMKKLYDCKTLDESNRVAEEYREIFATQVIGRFDQPLQEPRPRSRKAYETDKWIGYEVVLDVFPDVFAYGILILPKDLKEGEKRPVVVCQHGLEGRPQSTIGETDFQYYSGFAGRLAEKGFVTFAPQNIYIGRDRFRTLQRKANPLGKTLFSIMVPQHQQICNWLAAQPFVDGSRIAFYGLSYGGKSAMRIPPLVKNYCLSICSADFNEWVAKNASTRLPFSYVWTGEYEIFEFDLGGTFNYAEMAALIAPRPFMVERGHTDGVSTDEWVAFEFAKVFYHYDHRLKIGDRCEMEVFDGPHKINGVKTYDFLHKHLKWPK